ncbi:MAG: hypothetical protein Q9182_007523 [Xanthomendoza sp. 2 TL-2023]
MPIRWKSEDPQLCRSKSGGMRTLDCECTFYINGAPSPRQTLSVQLTFADYQSLKAYGGFMRLLVKGQPDPDSPLEKNFKEEDSESSFFVYGDASWRENPTKVMKCPFNITPESGTGAFTHINGSGAMEYTMTKDKEREDNHYLARSATCEFEIVSDAGLMLM